MDKKTRGPWQKKEGKDTSETTNQPKKQIKKEARTHLVHTISSTSMLPSPSSCIPPHLNPPGFISVRRFVTSRSSALIPLNRSSAWSANKHPPTPNSSSSHRRINKRARAEKKRKQFIVGAFLLGRTHTNSTIHTIVPTEYRFKPPWSPVSNVGRICI